VRGVVLSECGERMRFCFASQTYNCPDFDSISATTACDAHVQHVVSGFYRIILFLLLPVMPV
jgi:hypothetical protein